MSGKPRHLGCKVEGCNKSHDSKGYCTRHYYQWKRTGDPIPKQKHALAEEIATFVEVVVNTPKGTDCIDWPFGLGGQRYPRFKGKQASHEILERTGRPRPSLEHGAMHQCDRPVCVAWWHLSWGTNEDNQADKHQKGRGDGGPTGALVLRRQNVINPVR